MDLRPLTKIDIRKAAEETEGLAAPATHRGLGGAAARDTGQK